MPRRTTLDVIADILRTASAPTSRTHILYAANLSNRQAVRYVDMLVACSMLSKLSQDGYGAKFVTTENGQTFLSKISGKFGTILPGERSVWVGEPLPSLRAKARLPG